MDILDEPKLFELLPRLQRTIALFNSIHEREEAIVIHDLLKQGVNIDEKDSNGYTPLLLACNYRLKTIVNLLIDYGAKVHGPVCPFQRTLLHYASGLGWTEIVHLLVKREPDLPSMMQRDAIPCEDSIHAKDIRGRTALHVAALDGHLQIVKCLVEEGANLHLKNVYGKTALHEASDRGHLEVVKLLLEEGAILDTRDNYGQTALYKASSNGHLEIVQFLLEKGANMEVKTKRSETALHTASRFGYLKIVKCLVEKGCDIDARDEDGETAMHKASISHLNVVKYLVDKGADMEVDGSWGTPLFRAFQRLSCDVIVFLINSGANVDCYDFALRTVLHFASQHNWLELVQYLVKGVPVSDFILDRDSRDRVSRKANTCPTIDAICIDGGTALHLASFFGHIEVVKFLVAEGADLNVRNKHGMTALCEASNEGHLEVVKYLVEAGADMNVKCRNGGTSLLAAAFCGHKDIVDFLVNSGAHVGGFDEYNKTVLHYAVLKGWPCLVQYLVKEMSEKRMSELDARDFEGETALFFACRTGKLQYAKDLLQAGARLDVGNNGYLPFSYIMKFQPCAELIDLFVAAGAYLKPVDYDIILNNLSLKLNLLQDVNFCSRAIVNKYNARDLPALYELPASASLPRIEKIVIGSNNEVAQAIKRSVKLDIQKNGHCNLLEVRPMALSLFCVKSVLEYYDKKESVLHKGLKRLASSDSKNKYQRNKLMRLEEELLGSNL